MNLRILLQSRKNNLILVGEPGVGKTGIVEGFAQLLAEGKLPDALGRPAVIEISLTSTFPRESLPAPVARPSTFVSAASTTNTTETCSKN